MSNMNNQHEIESLNSHKLCQTYMDFIPLLLDEGNTVPCLILSDRALTYMIRALALQEHNSLFPPQVLTLEELILLLSTEGTSELDLALFVSSIHFFVHHTDFSLFRYMKITQLCRLIHKVDDLLCQLSLRMYISREEVYHSIFKLK